MRKAKAMRTALFIASAALYISIPASSVQADTIPTEQGVAGFAYLLDNYYSSTKADTVTADKTLINILQTEIISPYANLGVSKADSYVNVRSEPSTDSEVVGKLYRGCAADILEYLEGDWVKIQSGDVKGYIASNFLAIGREAEAMVDEYATQYATVDTQTLRVREKMSVDSDILTLIPYGETYPVVKDYGDWVEIVLGSDEDTGGDFTGFLSKDYIKMTVEFKFAISVEEEQRILREQQEAERAEAERKAKLVQEEAERKEAARRAEEDKKNNNNSNSNNSNNSNSSNNESPSHSGSDSGLRSEIIEYAQKFVGNRYVWGGESLTKGADCSGFVQAVYADFGYRLPRVSRDQASSAGKRVSESDMLPGDLVFYANSRGSVNHVAMYIGNGMIVHAANSRQGIIRSNVKYRDIYCVRRIVN
jgi:cell wall-associated NlpC family hydrolase